MENTLAQPFGAARIISQGFTGIAILLDKKAD
jgi:hypothetical protein